MGGINFNTGGGSSFDPANPGPIGGTTPNTGAFTTLTVAQGTLTDPVTGINLTATWNDAADTFRGIDIQITNTASAAASTLFRASVSGTQRIAINSRGAILSSPEFADGIDLILERDTSRRIYSNAAACLQVCGVSFHDAFGMGLRSGEAIAWNTSNTVTSGDLLLRRGAAATLQLGTNHATTATAQRIQAHGVTTGTGANLTLGGGSGDTKGNVILDGGNRSAYIASPSATEIRDILISHGLMAAS